MPKKISTKKSSRSKTRRRLYPLKSGVLRYIAIKNGTCPCCGVHLDDRLECPACAFDAAPEMKRFARRLISIQAPGAKGIWR